MTKPGLKKPRGKPFEKGDDPRRGQLVPGGKTAAFTREMKDCLQTAAENVGNRLVAISNARLPKQPSKEFTTGIFGSIWQQFAAKT